MARHSIVRDIKEPYKYEPHSWGNLKGITWAICKHCGLLRLKNDFTEWCVKMGCNNGDHPQFKSMRNKAGPKNE